MIVKLLKLRSTSSHFPNDVLIWHSQITDLRSGLYTHFLYDDENGKSVIGPTPAKVLLDIIDAGTYRVHTAKSGLYASIARSLLQVATKVLTVKSNKTPGVKYDILSLNNEYSIQRHGYTKTSFLKPSFKTVAQSIRYINVQLKEGKLAVC